MTAGTAVYLIGGVLCLLVSPSPWRRAWQLPRKYLLGCGFLFAFYTATIYLAVGSCRDRQQVLEIALVNYLWPTLTILFSIPLLKHRASLWLWPGTILALAGVFLVMTQGAEVSWHSIATHLQTNPFAYGLALAAAVSWGLYSNLTRLWSEPNSNGAVDIFMVVTGVILLGMRLLTTEPTLWSTRAAGEAAGLAAVTTIAYFLWDIAMRRGNLALVAACSYFTPLLSTIVSCLYLKVPPGGRLWTGCLLLVAGSIISWLSLSNRPDGAEPA